jgi:hypothetical protein
MPQFLFSPLGMKFDSRGKLALREEMNSIVVENNFCFPLCY